MSPNEERFTELWSDFLEGELDEAGIAELRQIMAEDQELLELAADTFQTHRLLGALSARESSDAFVRETVAKLPETGDRFAGKVIAQLSPGKPPRRTNSAWQTAIRYGGWAVAAMLMVMVFIWGQADKGNNGTISQATFASLAQASFFGELAPPVASNPDLNRSYSLVSGAVELAFPNGASTIIEGPAVFRVVSDERLALDIGQCSVHAPPGAEGFRVDTPTSRVVDRGTRFHVSVSELSETEVQVVEGAADLYPGQEGREKVHITDGNARRIGNGDPIEVSFSGRDYQAEVPDRIISYKARKNENGRHEELSEVTVQRGGQVLRFKAEELIPVELVSFYAREDSGPASHIIGDRVLPDRRASLLEDLRLDTGIINPGGSKQPLTGPFDPAVTPGFGVKFQRPVTNGPGPDVVFFEIQNSTYPPEGDAIHVSPLSWEDGLRTRTIRRYDLMLTAPEALPVASFHHYNTRQPILSLEELETASGDTSKPVLFFNALAVGIDLSDLGYEEGARVEGLFFQDAMNDPHYVDPVYIGGLPE